MCVLQLRPNANFPNANRFQDLLEIALLEIALLEITLLEIT